MRSRALHEWWTQRLALPLVRLNGNKPVHTLLGEIETAAAIP
jgi:hypothetical protein